MSLAWYILGWTATITVVSFALVAVTFALGGVLQVAKNIKKGMSL